MQHFGITFLPTSGLLYQHYPSDGVSRRSSVPSDQDQLTTDYASALAPDPRVVGYYVRDEPAISRQPETFHQYALLKNGRSRRASLAVINHAETCRPGRIRSTFWASIRIRNS